jgi:LysR family transcriptional regulator, glycine cleavage system transcriptional activator
MYLPSLSSLKCLEAVARLGGVTRAARELNLTQSAVSHQIIELEKTLGISLFERDRGRLIPTPICRRLTVEIDHVFQQLAQAVAAARAPQADDSLKLNMLPSVATKWLVPRLASFTARFHGIQLSIATSRNFTDFAREKVDAAIRYGRGRWAGVEAHLLGGESVFPVCSPAYAASLDLRATLDLGRVALLHGDNPEDWTTWCRHAAPGTKLANVGLHAGLHFTEDGSLIQAAIEGLGVALGRSVLVHDDLRAKRLVEPFGPRLEAQFQYWFVWPTKAPEKRSRYDALEWLHAEFARMHDEREASVTGLRPAATSATKACLSCDASDRQGSAHAR